MEWQTKWVTVIIKFAESYTNKSSAAVDVGDYGINMASSVCISIEIYCVYNIDTECDDYDQVHAIRALAAIFTILAKDKEQAPLHYWLEDYEVCLNVHVCNAKLHHNLHFRWLRTLKSLLQRYQGEILQGLGGL